MALPPPLSGSGRRRRFIATSTAPTATTRNANRHESAAAASAEISPNPVPSSSPASTRPRTRPRSTAGNQSPTSDDTAGYPVAAAIPRRSREHNNHPNDGAMALPHIAAAHTHSIIFRRRTRGTRSTSTPAGMVPTIATMPVAVTNNPIPVGPTENAR